MIAVGPAKKLNGRLNECMIVDSDSGLRDNVARGIEASKSKAIILAACDMPLLTPDSVDSFIYESRLKGGNVCYPIVHEMRSALMAASGIGRRLL